MGHIHAFYSASGFLTGDIDSLPKEEKLLSLIPSTHSAPQKSDFLVQPLFSNQQGRFESQKIRTCDNNIVLGENPLSQWKDTHYLMHYYTILVISGSDLALMVGKNAKTCGLKDN